MIVGHLAHRITRIWVSLFVICLATVSSTAVAQTWSESAAAYERGDYATAYRGFLVYAEQGDPYAQTMIGLMYDLGEGVPQDYAQSAVWFRRAAEQESAYAQYFTGTSYLLGHGVPQDYVQAYKWISLAISRLPASELRDTAMERLERATSHLSSSELSYAKRLAREWKPTYEVPSPPSSSSSQPHVSDSPASTSAQIQSGSFTYDDGSTYEGEFKDGKVHGKGTYFWPDGTTYTGDFLDGLPSGTGTLRWPTGGVYTGDFVDGEPEGTGTITWPTGGVYIGDFADGQPDGTGKLVWPSGDTYAGEFVSGWPEGTGTITWSGGITYTGGFAGGGLKGDGTITWPDGSTFSGTFDRRAAEQGNAIAQLSLGILHYYGLEVTQDYVQAHKWFNIAASRLRASEERAMAIRWREQVASHLSTAQLAVAHRLAREWQPTEESQSPTPRHSHFNVPDSPPPAHLAIAGTGSGFRVSTEGYILTNAHVVRGCSEVRAPPENAVRVVAYDDATDLALLKSPSTSTDAVASFRQGRGIRPGASVVVIGHPLHGILASEASISAGVVSALAGPGDDRRLIQITAPIQPGNSGGPVVDSAANVIGVVVARLGRDVVRDTGHLPQNVNFAVAAGAARAFLDAEDVPYRTEPSDTPLPSDRVAAVGKDFTVLCRMLEAENMTT